MKRGSKMEVIDILEGQMKGLIENNNASPLDCLIAVHNLCAHGTMIENAGGVVYEKELGNLFKGFDKSIKSLKIMMGQ